MKKALTIFLLLFVCIIAISCGNGDGVAKDKISFDFSLNSTDPSQIKEVSLRELKNDLSQGKYIPHEYYEGYIFKGFYTSDGVMYIDNEGKLAEGIELKGGLTLIAKYEIKSMKLEFHSLNDRESVEAVTYFYGDKLYDFPRVEITNPRYELDGWFDFTGTHRYSNGTKPIYETATDKLHNTGTWDYDTYTQTKLYPKLKYKEHKVTVEFTDGVTKSESFYVAKGDKLDLTGYYRDKGNMDIVGWSTMAGAVAPVPQYVTEDITVYAVWKQYKNVEFVYNDSYSITSKIYYAIGESSELIKDDIAGYDLLGWSDNPELNGGLKLNVPYGLLYDKYYASLAEVSYVITLKNGEKEIAKIPYTYGTEIELPEYSENDYTIYAGYYESNPDNAVYKLGSDTWGDKTLYVKGVLMEEALALYFENDGEKILNTQYYTYGEKIHLPKYECDNGVFLGWYDSLGNPYYDGMSLFTTATLTPRVLDSVPISSFEDLKNISSDGKYYLTCDIDAKFGIINQLEKFDGVIDGRGYTISNLAINSANEFCGFIKENNGEIKNLSFKNVSFTQKADGSVKGGIIAVTNNGKLVGCQVSGNISINAMHLMVNGGICGEATDSSLIQNCSVDLNIKCEIKGNELSATSYLGGMVGKCAGKVENCSSYVKIDLTIRNDKGSAPFVYTGGLIGGQGQGTELNVSICNARGEIIVDDYGDEKPYNSAHYNAIGGLIGEITKGRIDYSYTDRILISSKNHQFNFESYAGEAKGAFVGICNKDAKISNSYALISDLLFVNTIAGFVGSNAGEITRCFSMCENNDLDIEVRYGFAGFVYLDGKITNSFTLYKDFCQINRQFGTIERCFSGNEAEITEEFIFEKIYFQRDIWTVTKGEIRLNY